MKLLITALLLAAFAAPASALSTAQSRADGGVTIRANVSNGVVLDPGDRISFQYQSQRDAAVIVFDIDTQGHVSLLHDEPISVRAHESHTLPDQSSELFAEGEPGIEFVFAVAVADPGAIDNDAFRSLLDESRQINGDPFIAANMIAAELVRDISQHPVHLGYTYFYVSERVEYPCYLCGTCDGSAPSSECDGYRIAQNFDRNVSLSYPLARGYDMIEVSSTQTETVDDTAASPVIPDEPTDVNFYPYGAEVYYADPMAMNLYYDYGWYDPWYGYYPYGYPYYGSYFSIGFGYGWGWGWGWGGYYCSGWYDPWYGCGYYPYYGCGYYPGDGGSYPSNVTRYKSQYKDGGATTLAGNRTFASKSDGDLRVASKGMKTSPTGTAFRSKSGTRAGTQVAKGSYGSSHKVKTSVRGVTRNTWAKGRSGSSSYKNVPVYRGQRTSKASTFQPKGTAGKSVMERSGYKRSGNRAVTPQRSGSYAPQRGTTTRSKSSYSPGRNSAPRSSGTSAPRMGSSYKGGHSGGATMRGGGGGRSSGGGGSRGGGGMKGGRGR